MFGTYLSFIMRTFSSFFFISISAWPFWGDACSSVNAPTTYAFGWGGEWIIKPELKGFQAPGKQSICVWCVKLYTVGASLVAQWLRIRLPMQGTQVWALVPEDPTCRGATKPVRHNYWACALEPASHNYWACMLQLLKPVRLEPVLLNKEKAPQWEACAPQRRVAPARRTRESPRAATKTQCSQK